MPKSSTASFLTKDAGPLPVWGWVIVAIASFYLYTKYINPPSSTDVSPPPTSNRGDSSRIPSSRRRPRPIIIKQPAPAPAPSTG